MRAGMVISRSDWRQTTSCLKAKWTASASMSWAWWLKEVMWRSDLRKWRSSEALAIQKARTAASRPCSSMVAKTRSPTRFSMSVSRTARSSGISSGLRKSRDKENYNLDTLTHDFLVILVRDHFGLFWHVTLDIDVLQNGTSYHDMSYTTRFSMNRRLFFAN